MYRPIKTSLLVVVPSVNWCQSECGLTTATSNVQQQFAHSEILLAKYSVTLVKHGLIGCDLVVVTVIDDIKITWRSKVAVCHIYCLSLSSTSFTHFLFLGCFSFPLLLKNFLSLNIR